MSKPRPQLPKQPPFLKGAPENFFTVAWDRKSATSAEDGDTHISPRDQFNTDWKIALISIYELGGLGYTADVYRESIYACDCLIAHDIRSAISPIRTIVSHIFSIFNQQGVMPEARATSLLRFLDYYCQYWQLRLYYNHYADELSEYLGSIISSPWQEEGLMEGPLHEYLHGRRVPESMRLALAAKIETLIDSELRAATRPKWDERGKYAELKDLSAPLFLKRVYADEIAPDGTIKKETVRATDKTLMARVETYISNREERNLPLGDAEGLRFATKPAGRPKRGGLGRPKA